MGKIFKLYTVSLLTVALSVATVICCFSAPAVAAHFNKAVACSHCPATSSHDNSPNPAGTCKQQLTSAEFFHSQTVSSSAVSGGSFPASASFKHITIFLPSSVLAYPRGSPPLGVSFTPLYLRTFNLRV